MVAPIPTIFAVEGPILMASWILGPLALKDFRLLPNDARFLGLLGPTTELGTCFVEVVPI